jgi:hypothetical protein
VATLFLSSEVLMASGLKAFIAHRCPVPPWLRRIGLLGFLFFLIKGVLWLTLPGVLLFFGLQ